MSGYGIFESAATDGMEQEQRKLQAQSALDGAIFAARDQFGAWLGEAMTRSDFDDRLALVKKDLFKTVEASGIAPVSGVMNKVYRSLRPNFKAKQAAAAKRTAKDYGFLAPGEGPDFQPSGDWTGADTGSAEWVLPDGSKAVANRDSFMVLDQTGNMIGGSEAFSLEDAQFQAEQWVQNAGLTARRKQAKGPWEDVPTMLEPVPVADWSQYDDMPPEHVHTIGLGRENCPACKAEGTTTAATNDDGKELVNKGDWEGYLDEVSPQSEPAAEKNFSGDSKTKDSKRDPLWAALKKSIEAGRPKQAVEYNPLLDLGPAGRRAIADYVQWARKNNEDPYDLETLDLYNDNGDGENAIDQDDYNDISDAIESGWDMENVVFGGKTKKADNGSWQTTQGPAGTMHTSESNGLHLKVTEDGGSFKWTVRNAQGVEIKSGTESSLESAKDEAFTQASVAGRSASLHTADHWKFDQAFQQFLLDSYGTTHGLTDTEIIEAMEQYAGIGSGPEVIGEPVDSVPPAALPGQPLASKRKKADYNRWESQGSGMWIKYYEDAADTLGTIEESPDGFTWVVADEDDNEIGTGTGQTLDEAISQADAAFRGGF